MTIIPLLQGRPLRHCRPLLPGRCQDRVHQQCGLRGPLRRVTCSDLGTSADNRHNFTV